MKVSQSDDLGDYAELLARYRSEGTGNDNPPFFKPDPVLTRWLSSAGPNPRRRRFLPPGMALKKLHFPIAALCQTAAIIIW